MAKKEEGKGLSKPETLKAELAALLGKKELPRTEIVKGLWDYIKKHKLQSKEVNGKPTGEGKNIVVDAKLLPIVAKTNLTSKSGNKTDLRSIKEGQTVDMMKVALIVAANIE